MDEQALRAHMVAGLARVIGKERAEQEAEAFVQIALAYAEPPAVAGVSVSTEDDWLVLRAAEMIKIEGHTKTLKVRNEPYPLLPRGVERVSEDEIGTTGAELP